MIAAGGARSGESRIGPLIQGSSTGQALKGARPPREARRGGNPRRAEMGLRRSRSCSWIVEIADVGARRPSPPCESRRRGPDGDRRRSGSAKSPSFDEAAAAANLALPHERVEKRRERRETRKGWRGVPVRRAVLTEESGRTAAFSTRSRERDKSVSGGYATVPWPNTPSGGSTPRKALDQEPTGPSGAGPLGKPRDIKGHAKARGSPSSEALPEVTSFANASAGRAAVEATIEGESRRRG